MAEKSTTQDGGLRPSGGIIANPADGNTETAPFLSNAEIADRLASLAQLLSAQKENPYKVKAYQRAAAKLRNMSESLQELETKTPWRSRSPPFLQVAPAARYQPLSVVAG